MQDKNDGRRDHYRREDAHCLFGTPSARALARQQRVVDFLEGKGAHRRRVLLRILTRLGSLSWRLDPRIQLYGRLKTIASISDKMSANALGVHQVLDIIGVRVITQHTRDCYHLVELIHREFAALEAEYDDYISVPKPNGYRSIHTTVVGSAGFPVEVQVRTQWMDALAERGSAAHSRYKHNRAVGIPLPDYHFTSGGIARTRDPGPRGRGESEYACDGGNACGPTRTTTSDDRPATYVDLDPSRRPYVQT